MQAGTRVVEDPGPRGGLEVCVLARWVWDMVGGGLARKRGRWRKLERNGHGSFLCLQQASTRCPRAWQVTGVTRAWPNQPAASTSAGIPLARCVPNRSWILTQPVPPPCRVGAVAASLWRGHPGRGQISRTQSQQGACGQSSSGSGGMSWVSTWGKREGRGLGQAAEHWPVWGPGLGAATWGEREGLDPSVPSPETLRESDSQGKSQGFCMLTIDSLFPKTQEG